MQLSELDSINRRVNESVTYKTDIEEYNQLEFWNVAGTVGDCEDYCLLKIHRLLAAGLPISAMSLVVCAYEGEGHCVLFVELDGETYVLDNNSDQLLFPEDTPYEWIKVQTPGTPEWREMKLVKR
jgi:predicted transglutaminase-like cysteine proteinase